MKTTSDTISPYRQLHLSKDVVICIKPTGEITYLNPAASQLPIFRSQSIHTNIRTIFDQCIYKGISTTDGVTIDFPVFIYHTQPSNDMMITLTGATNDKSWWLVNTIVLSRLENGKVSEMGIVLKHADSRLPVHNHTSALNVYSMFDNDENAFVITDHALNIIYFNNSANVLHQQFSKINLQTGASALNVLMPDGVKNNPAILQDVLNGNKKKMICQFTDSNNNIGFFTIKFLPLYQHNILEGIIIRYHDITEKYVEPVQVWRNHTRFEFASLASSEMFWELDIPSMTMNFNPENLRRIFGHDVKSPMSFHEYFELTRHPDSFVDLQQYINHIQVHDNEVKEYPIRKVRKADGSTGYVSVKVIANRDETGLVNRVFGTTVDITEKYLAEEELKKSNERYELAALASFDMFWDVDVKTGILTFSKTIHELYGYDIKNPISDIDFIRLIVHPDDRSQLIKSIKDFIKSKDIQRELPVHRIVKKDGSIAYVMVRVMAIREKNGYAKRLIGVSRDITANHLAEQELRKSNERFQLLADTSHDMLWEMDFVTDRIFFSDAMHHLFGYDNKEVWSLERLVNDVIHQDDREWLGKFMNENLVSRVAVFHCPTHRYIRKDGSIAYVQVHGKTIYNEEGIAVKAIGVSRDVTDLRKLEEKFAEEEVIHFQEMAEITIETQEREREELGRELHDNVNQILASVKLNLEMAISDPNARDYMLKKSFANIQDAIAEIRSVSHGLISPVIDIGLEDATRQLIENITTASTTEFEFDCCDADYSQLGKAIQLMIYRIIQEQISNILKHAKASRAKIAFSLENKQFNLIITDNGIGFNQQHQPAGVGLRNIRSRVQLYRGKVSLDCNQGQGCILKVCIPVRETNSNG